MIAAILAGKLREATQDLCLTASSSPPHAELKLSNAEREREREMCAHARTTRPRAPRGSTGDSQRLNKVWAAFLREKVSKGDCNVAKLATPLISSPSNRK